MGKPYSGGALQRGAPALARHAVLTAPVLSGWAEQSSTSQVSVAVSTDAILAPRGRKLADPLCAHTALPQRLLNPETNQHVKTLHVTFTAATPPGPHSQPVKTRHVESVCWKTRWVLVCHQLAPTCSHHCRYCSVCLGWQLHNRPGHRVRQTSRPLYAADSKP